MLQSTVIGVVCVADLGLHNFNRVRTIHKKTGPDRFNNFMSPWLAESVPGPVLINGNKMCVFPAADDYI